MGTIPHMTERVAHKLNSNTKQPLGIAASMPVGVSVVPQLGCGNIEPNQALFCTAADPHAALSAQASSTQTPSFEVAFVRLVPVNKSGLTSSKYPPAEPVALRLLAPSKGHFRNRPRQKQEQKQKPRTAVVTAAAQAIRGRTYSRNSQSSTATPAEPGRAGGTPFWISAWGLSRFTATNASLQLLVEMAFGIEEHQIRGAPNWLESQEYDIDAKTGGSSYL